MIAYLKCYLSKYFQIKNLGSLWFLGIEVARSTGEITISQKKYVLDMLSEAGKLGCRVADAPMETNVKLLPNQGRS